MKWTPNKIAGISTIVLFFGIFVVAFVVYPDIGEKILYGKHPPGKEKAEIQEYAEIIGSKNYKCMESASLTSQGKLSEFIKKFNDCNE